jgi:putative tricarboxylic transport membrane protein
VEADRRRIQAEGELDRPRRRAIGNPKDFYAGIALLALSATAFWASRDLSGSQGLTFGAGTAPRLFAGLLACVGALITVLGIVTRGAKAAGFAIRGPLLILASVLVFAGAVKPLGLVAATFITVLVTSAASPETRWREAIPWAAVLSAACSVLFVTLLGLPIDLWPHLRGPFF